MDIRNSGRKNNSKIRFGRHGLLHIKHHCLSDRGGSWLSAQPHIMVVATTIRARLCWLVPPASRVRRHPGGGLNTHETHNAYVACGSGTYNAQRRCSQCTGAAAMGESAGIAWPKPSSLIIVSETLASCIVHVAV